MASEVCAPKTAQDLLLEFKSTGREEPFEEIVRRYAGMVYHVCLRVTKNNHDAEDATQAVFLTLAVQTRANKEIRYIGPWLQQVAHRLSLDLRKSRKRRERREEKHREMATAAAAAAVAGSSPGGACECGDHLQFEELKGVINQEINKLPPKYRMPLILHYFGGLSRDEMARELNCKPGTLGVRLHRAREMLGERLARRGIAMAEGTMGLALAYAVQSAVAEQIISSTCEAAHQIAMGQDVAHHLVSSHLVAMARGAVRAVLLAKVKTVAALVIATGCAVGAGAEMVSHVGPLDLGLDLQFRIGEWVKQILVPAPSLRVKTVEGSLAPPRQEIVSGPITDGGGSDRYLVTIEPMQVKRGEPLASSALPVMEGLIGGGASRRESVAVPRPMQHPLAISEPRATRPVEQVHVPRWHGPLAVASPATRHPGRQIVPLYTAPPPIAFEPPRGRVNKPIALDRSGWDRPTMGGGGWGGDRPQGPIPSGNVGNGGNNGGGVVGGPRKAVEVANSARRPPVSLYLKPAPPAGSAGAARSPASVALRGTAGGPAPPLATGSSTYVNYDNPLSGNFVVTVPLKFTDSPSGGILVSQSNLLDTGWNAVADASPMGTPDVAPRYSDQTFYRYNPELDKVVVLGTRSAARINGITVESTPARLSGYGVIGPADSFDQSGQVIADGVGQIRTLDLSQISWIRNMTDNPPGGANGWYARHGGRLKLPEIRVMPGTRTYTWGEEAMDQRLDLVNSVRLRVRDALTPGDLELALLSVDGAAGTPTLPTGNTVIGMWHIDGDALHADGVDLTVRYDAALLADLGLDEAHVKLWGYEGGTWSEVRDGFMLDAANNLVEGSFGSVRYFAVAVTPEPGALMMGLAGAGMLMRRRRR